MKNQVQYDYIVKNISKGNEVGYKALIPAFDSVVFGESLSEVEDGVKLAIEEEVKYRKSKNIKIPTPDTQNKYSGKILLRINPELHEMLSLKAKAQNKSVNTLIKEKIAN